MTIDKPRWYDHLIVWGSTAIIYGAILYGWFWILGEIFHEMV